MSNGNLSTIIQSGFDAFTNLYDISVTWPSDPKLTAVAKLTAPSVSVRALDFTPPELEPTRYPVDYKGIQLSRLGSKIEGDRIFSLMFRIDSEYYLYQALRQWKHLWANPSDEGEIKFGSYGDLTHPDLYGAIRVNGHKSSTVLSDIVDPTDITYLGAQWSFDQVVCVKTGTPSYVRAGGSDALTVTADFMFGAYFEAAPTV
jgi:hypothetical protein